MAKPPRKERRGDILRALFSIGAVLAEPVAFGSVTQGSRRPRIGPLVGLLPRGANKHYLRQPEGDLRRLSTDGRELVHSGTVFHPCSM
jgi:hypothetical protein